MTPFPEMAAPLNRAHAPPFWAAENPVTVYFLVPVVPHRVAVHPASAVVYEQLVGGGGGPRGEG